MKLHIRYIWWREGRPRFQPSASMRNRGHKGEDLRHPDGAWFTAEEAKAYSNQKAEVAKRHRPAEATPNRGRNAGTGPNYRRGYVYFLRSGNLIKIGFSETPENRLASLRTALALGVHSIVIVQGSEWHEKRAHRVLHRHRRHGEWFEAHSEVIAMMARSAIEGIVSLSS